MMKIAIRKSKGHVPPVFGTGVYNMRRFLTIQKYKAILQDTCTFKLNATAMNQYVEDGWYAIALTIEDYPKQSIIVGKETYNETTPLSQVPLQVISKNRVTESY